MKKVLFVIGSLQAGGAERVATNLCSHWADVYGLDVTLLTSDIIYNDFYHVSEKVNRVSMEFSFHKKSIFKELCEQFIRFFKINKFLRKISPDIVILSTTEISVRFLFNLIFSSKKIIVCEHNNYYALSSSFKRLCRTLLYKKASYVIVLTERDRRTYLENKIVKKNRLIVMQNPLGIENKVLNAFEENTTLLAVGRLCEQKSFDRLIEAMVSINKKYQLKIVGDGPDKLKLQKQIDELKLSDRVTLVGKVIDVGSYYKAASLLLMTSKYEGLPMVIGEANSFGLPVISFDCPTGPSEMIENYQNGVLVKNGDIIEFAKVVNSVLANPKQLLEMRYHSFDMSKTYSIDTISSRWLDILELKKY